MKKIIVIVLALLFFAVPIVVVAQEQVTPISQKNSIIEEIAEVRRTYKGQLAEYRQSYNQYVISKGQFEQLNTLASLEIAVQDFREVMSLRSQVLLTYLKLIELELLEADGINLEEKTLALDQTKELQRDLRAHKDLVDNAIDRQAVNRVAQDFVLLNPRVINLSNFASSLLKIGKLQTIYDQSVTLVEATDPRNQTDQPSLKLNEMIRAHNEVTSLMGKIETDLDLVWDSIKEARVKNDVIDTTKTNLTVYANLSQVLDFLEEIVLDR